MVVMKKILILIFCLPFSLLALSQQKKVKLEGWHLKDGETDGYMGISLNKAYQLLKGRKSTTVIVAVIDSGIDTLHEDLKPILWKNEKEITGNGKDDDGNGYADDIYGWNFCGSKEGENLSRNSHEITRVYHNWRKEFEGKKETDIPKEKKFLLSQWLKAASMINKDYEEAKQQLPGIKHFLTALETASKNISAHLKVQEFNGGQIKPLLKNPDKTIEQSAALWTDVFTRSADNNIKNTVIIKEVTDYKNQLENKIKRKEEPPEDTRGALVKDNYLDINDRSYGNNNLKAHSGDHGTMVAGVIAAIRNNNVGVEGIADNVRIMAIRAMPGGDEHDKDVALAIRYAVDNGAKIINMSFGKPVSPYKQFVDDAVRYAAAKGVLLVHGAGNDGKDISKDLFYPHPLFLDSTRATNYLTVGASGDESTGEYAAPFSNYSREWVDVFAPGVFIHSSATNNRYVSADGTSLASPVVSGVAALLKSYFPQLTPQQIVSIINTSGRSIDKDVLLPGSENKKVKFASLSSSGKIINAYESVKLALETEKQMK